MKDINLNTQIELRTYQFLSGNVTHFNKSFSSSGSFNYSVTIFLEPNTTWVTPFVGKSFSDKVCVEFVLCITPKPPVQYT